MYPVTRIANNKWLERVAGDKQGGRADNYSNSRHVTRARADDFCVETFCQLSHSAASWRDLPAAERGKQKVPSEILIQRERERQFAPGGGLGGAGHLNEVALSPCHSLAARRLKRRSGVSHYANPFSRERERARTLVIKESCAREFCAARVDKSAFVSFSLFVLSLARCATWRRVKSDIV